MRSLRLWSGVFISLVLALSTATAGAQNVKYFSLSPSSPAITASQVTIEFKNVDSGNSSFNSLSIEAVGNGATVVINSGTGTPGGPGVQSGQGTAKLTLTGLSPVKKGKTIAVTLNVTVTAAAGSCSPSITWKGGAWTGQVSSPSTAFETQGANPVSSVGTPCTLGLVAPASIVRGEPFSVDVTLKDGAGNPVTAFNGPTYGVSITGCATGSGSPTGGTAAIGGLVTTTSASSCTITASTTYGGAPYSKTSESIKVFDGSLDCEEQFSAKTKLGGVGGVFVLDDQATGYSKGIRGKYNKDGSDCERVNYTFLNDIVDNNSVSLAWDVTGNQKGAAFEYTVVWKDEYVNASTGLPSGVTTLQWGSDPIVNGRACLGPELPAPYGTLAAISASQIEIAPAAGSPPVPSVPFAIAIGNERLHVDSIDLGNANLWNVSRGQGGKPAPAVEHVIGVKVMSNPLPLDSQSTPKQMQMCIVQETWYSVLPGEPDCDGGLMRACIRVRTTIFDLGDGVVSRTGGGGN